MKKIILASTLSLCVASAFAAGAKLDQKSKDQPGILDVRKKELLQRVDKFTVNFTEKSMFTKRIAKQGIQALMEQEPPTTLAFQRLDEQYLLCLNTGEKIAV